MEITNVFSDHFIDLHLFLGVFFHNCLCVLGDLCIVFIITHEKVLFVSLVLKAVHILMFPDWELLLLTIDLFCSHASFSWICMSSRPPHMYFKLYI